MLDFRILYKHSNDKLVCIQSVQDIMQTDLETAETTIAYFERIGYLDKGVISGGVKYWSITPKAEAVWDEKR